MIETEKIQLGSPEQHVPVEVPASVAGSTALESSEPQVNPNNGTVTTVAEPISTSAAQQPIADGISDNSDGDVTDSDTWGTVFRNKRQGEIPA